MITMEELLTVEEAARILKAHPDTIRRWLKEGELEGFKVGPHGRLWKIRQESVRRFIEKQEGRQGEDDKK